MEPEAARETDRVILRQIPFNLRIGNDAWGRDKPQPVLLSLEIPYDFQNAARDDNVSQTLDYGKLYKTLTEQLTGPYASAAEMVLLIRRILGPGASFQSTIVLPKANLRAEGGMHFQLKLESKVMEVIALSQSVSIKGIRCACIVGVNAHEREEKQIVVINLGLKRLDVAYEDPEMFEKHPDEPVETIMFHASYAEMVREVVKVSISYGSRVIRVADQHLIAASRRLNVSDS